MTSDDFAYTDPHDLRAEQAVLGAMLLSAAAAAECLSALAAADFYRRAHQVVFAGHPRAGARAARPPTP